MIRDDTDVHIAIVGMGPKGFYSLERLLAHLQMKEAAPWVHVHLFNRSRYMGSGDVYRSDQPPYLLMNYPNHNIRCWSEESPPPVVPNPEPFVQWLARATSQSPRTLAHAYASRARVGRYLEDGFDLLYAHLPAQVTLHTHITDVQAIVKDGSSYCVQCTDDTHTTAGIGHVMLTTGHQRKEKEHRTTRVGFIYPVEEQLNSIPGGGTVAMRGMGLTCIDAALALTEGRGGQFTEREGTLEYTPSGAEPGVIYPFSRSGQLMVPRQPHTAQKHEPRGFLKQQLQKAEKPYQLMTGLMPALRLDMQCAYYSRRFREQGIPFPDGTDAHRIQAAIEAFHRNHPEEPVFSFERLFEPVDSPSTEWDAGVRGWLRDVLERLARDPYADGLLAAGYLWQQLSAPFNQAYSHKGLDAESHRLFDHHYAGPLNRVAYGPPALNMKKIEALARAGLINFSMARAPSLSKSVRGYTLSRPQGKSVTCAFFVDARIPKTNIQADRNPLYRSLCHAGLARPLINEQGKEPYAPGGIDITPRGQLINQHGDPQPGLFAYGTPTEGATYDNDTLSRTRNNFATSWATYVVDTITQS